MTYKLLVENGIAFVCLEDGTRLPYQIETTVEQGLREPALATVSLYVYISKPYLSGNMVRFDNNGLSFLENRLEDLIGLELHPVANEPTIVAKFTVECAFGDTKEAPINVNQKDLG